MSFNTQQKVRIVTAASLFDGHDAAINIMRRILQSKGAEIIHLGHNRSVAEIVLLLTSSVYILHNKIKARRTVMPVPATLPTSGEALPVLV